MEISKNAKYFIIAGVVIAATGAFLFWGSIKSALGMIGKDEFSSDKDPAKTDKMWPTGLIPGNYNSGNHSSDLWELQIKLAGWIVAVGKGAAAAIKTIKAGPALDIKADRELWGFYLEMGGNPKAKNWKEQDESITAVLKAYTPDARTEWQSGIDALKAAGKIPENWQFNQ